MSCTKGCLAYQQFAAFATAPTQRPSVLEVEWGFGGRILLGHETGGVASLFWPYFLRLQEWGKVAEYLEKLHDHLDKLHIDPQGILEEAAECYEKAC